MINEENNMTNVPVSEAEEDKDFVLEIAEGAEENTEEDVVEYDITTSPRDWNPSNIVELIDSGIMELPLFQRNYVWDIKKASRLIESLILGLPVPELFVYVDDDEESTYKIIDGQQRILSIYFFMKGRFPKNTDSRNSIRMNLNNGQKLEEILSDDKQFRNFYLKLSEESRYNGKRFTDLEDMQVKLRLRRYVRAISIRQNKPDNNSASMFEIFNRLNTGGVKLNPQEIRASLYYCPFYDMMAELNLNPGWRSLLGNETPELHSKDIELILRAFALLEKGSEYRPKMITFLNNYSQESKKFKENKIEYLKNLFLSFIDTCSELGEKAFFKGNKFSIALFESVFVAVCKQVYSKGRVLQGKINKKSFKNLKDDLGFAVYSQRNSTSRENVAERINCAEAWIKLDGENY